MRRSGHDRPPVRSDGGLLESARQRVLAQAEASLNLWGCAARYGESMKGAGNNMDFCWYSGPDQPASIFQVFFHKQIERAHSDERRGQPRQIGGTRGYGLGWHVGRTGLYA